MITLTDWLEAFCSPEDVVPGACFVGNNRGTDHSNWHVVDREVLLRYINASA